jgi:hypothetical protein
MKKLFPYVLFCGLLASVYVIIKRFNPELFAKIFPAKTPQSMVYPTSFFAPSIDYTPNENDYSRFSYFK